MNNSPQEEQPIKVKVWDLPIRLFHWALAIGFVVSFVSIKIDDMDLHITSAMCILGLLVFRFLWGFCGSRTAKFSQFIPSPRHLLNYLTKKGTPEDEIGHSPLGALSVIALLFFMLFQLLTGLVADDEIYTTGPLRDMVSSDFSSWATSTHAFMADFLLALIALHVAAILFYWIFKKNNLIKAMITGNKNVVLMANTHPYGQYKKTIAAIVIIVSGLMAYGIFNWL